MVDMSVAFAPLLWYTQMPLQSQHFLAEAGYLLYTWYVVATLSLNSQYGRSSLSLPFDAWQPLVMRCLLSELPRHFPPRTMCCVQVRVQWACRLTWPVRSFIPWVALVKDCIEQYLTWADWARRVVMSCPYSWKPAEQNKYVILPENMYHKVVRGPSL